MSRASESSDMERPEQTTRWLGRDSQVPLQVPHRTWPQQRTPMYSQSSTKRGHWIKPFQFRFQKFLLTADRLCPSPVLPTRWQYIPSGLEDAWSSRGTRSSKCLRWYIPPCRTPTVGPLRRAHAGRRARRCRLGPASAQADPRQAPQAPSPLGTRRSGDLLSLAHYVGVVGAPDPASVPAARPQRVQGRCPCADAPACPLRRPRRSTVATTASESMRWAASMARASRVIAPPVMLESRGRTRIAGGLEDHMRHCMRSAATCRQKACCSKQMHVASGLKLQQ